VRSTRAAPAGTCNSPCRPTPVNWSFSTMKMEFSMGGAPSPVMSRAPSNTVARGDPVAGLSGSEAHAPARRHATPSKHDDVLFSGLTEASYTVFHNGGAVRPEFAVVSAFRGG